MADIYALILTIVLGIVGILVSVGGLVLAIIMAVKFTKLNNSVVQLEKIKEILIIGAVENCCLYSDDNERLSGKEVINSIKEKYQCDDYTALKIFYCENKNQNKDL